MATKVEKKRDRARKGKEENHQEEERRSRTRTRGNCVEEERGSIFHEEEKEVDKGPCCNTKRSTPPQTYGAHCVPLGASTPPWRFYRGRGDTSRDTAAFIERTPCFFSEKLRVRGSLKIVGLLASSPGKSGMEKDKRERERERRGLEEERVTTGPVCMRCV